MNKEIVGIIGAGTMGGGIAQMFAENGFKTLLWDVNADFTNKGIEKIQKRLNKSVETGKLAKERAEDISSKINKATDLSEFNETDLVIEAIIEDYDVKVELYKKLEKIVGAETIIGSNTSSLSISDLSGNLNTPERFLGIHFFNPPTKLELVEVIATSSLSPQVSQKVNDILTRCGKSAVKVNDSPGFIVNRLLLPFINEAAKLLDSGVAKAEDIDTAMRLGTLHPAGPLQVADLIGLDICKDILEKLAESLHQENYKPAKSIVDLVKAGKLGRKTGEGFHVY
ncbi:MAG: 3-hydroxyacyl-CoA dehydrogenase family protein [Victivallaceae bacterium]|nr:3-hydroxyacyl-CoA dehydrogenase family protein [Victivallaceae bacterium]